MDDAPSRASPRSPPTHIVPAPVHAAFAPLPPPHRPPPAPAPPSTSCTTPACVCVRGLCPLPGKNFTEGWVEFEDKRRAKRAAALLNGQPMGGRKRSAYYYDLWALKYLPKFKWVALGFGYESWLGRGGGGPGEGSAWMMRAG